MSLRILLFLFLQNAAPLLSLTLGRMFTSHMVLQAEPQVYTHLDVHPNLDHQKSPLFNQYLVFGQAASLFGWASLAAGEVHNNIEKVEFLDARGPFPRTATARSRRIDSTQLSIVSSQLFNYYFQKNDF